MPARGGMRTAANFNAIGKARTGLPDFVFPKSLTAYPGAA